MVRHEEKICYSWNKNGKEKKREEGLLGEVNESENGGSNRDRKERVKNEES